MKIIKAKAELHHPGEVPSQFKSRLYQQIEFAARQCYQSGELAGLGTAEKLIDQLVRRGHTAMLDHSSMSVLFTVNRGVTHEIVRHRLAAYAQESTRYCNYQNGKFGSEVCYIDIADGIARDPKMQHLSADTVSRIMAEWYAACLDAERHYMRMLELGASPQIARNVLNHSTKSAIVMTADITEWRHFFRLRAIGTTGAPHPEMLQATTALLEHLRGFMPELFGDL